MKIEQVIQFETREQSITEHVILYKGEAYTFFDNGLTRYVFANADKTKVIKILIKKDSYDYNEEEFDIYNNASESNRTKMAKTELTYNGEIIEQEFCNPIKFDNRSLTIPQILFANKCRNEVGWNKNGELVCFDLNEFMKY
jgi:hypothetical protein